MGFEEWFDSTTYQNRCECQAAWEASTKYRTGQIVDLALHNSELAEQLDEMKAVLKFWRDEVDTPESAQLFEIMVKGVLKDD